MYKKFIYNNSALKQRRQDLRNAATSSERLLWKELQKSKLGVKFRRQHGIGNYILDFYCPERKLAIELDGSIHEGRKDLDDYRTRTLKEHKIRVIRFWNSEIEKETDSVLEKIRMEILETPS